MRTILQIITTFLGAILLVNACKEVGKNNKLPHKISFYYRIEGQNGDYLSYSDNLVYSNYENGVLFAKDLFPIAKQYIDTVRADAPASSVNFVGLGAGERLPKKGFENIFEQRKYFVIDFIFNNGLEKFAGQPLRLTGIMIYKDAKAHYFWHADQVDSVLNSPVPLDNE